MPFRSQYVYESQTLLIYSRKNFCPIVSSSWSRLSWKTYLLVISSIIGLFVNTLSAYDYSRHNRETLPEPIKMWISKKPKDFLNFSLHFCSLYRIFSIYKKWQASQLKYFQNCWHPESLLLICLKGNNSERTYIANVFTGTKHCWNLHNSILILLRHHPKTKSARKRLS